MGFQKLAVIHSVDHIAGSDDYIWFMSLFNELHIFDKGSNIIVVDIIVHTVFGIEKMKFSSLGVDVVMTSGSQMFGEGTWFSADIYLDTVNAAVAHIGDREVDHTVTSQEGKCAYGTIGLHTFYMYISSGKIYNSKCLAHIILPPLHVLRRARYVRCQRCLLWRFCRYVRRLPRWLSVLQRLLLRLHRA